MHDLGQTQRDCLKVLYALEEATGVEIREYLCVLYGYDVDGARMYPHLDTLDEKGLIRKEDTGSRENQYSILRKGKREVMEYKAALDFFTEGSGNDPEDYPLEDLEEALLKGSPA